MKKFCSFAFLLSLSVLPVAAHAQGSGSSGSRPSPPPRDVRDSGPERAFAVARSVTGKIVEVNQEQAIFFVEDKKGNRHELKLTAKTRVKGDKSKEAMSKEGGSMEEKEAMMKKEEAMAKEGGSMEEKEMMMKKSMIQSLQVGQKVKVTYVAFDSTAIEIQLRK